MTVFLPQWTTLLLRAAQSRELRHRMGSRSLIIGDVPWVSQCAEAFLSKLFACTFNATAINVWAANPEDHLVHRFTHRVVRGALLLVGRPDGRLLSLTTAESAVCLAVNQASSIQSLGGTCESFTIGANPYKLALTKGAVFLDCPRPNYLCEEVGGFREAGGAAGGEAGASTSGRSPNALLGAYSHMLEGGDGKSQQTTEQAALMADRLKQERMETLRREDSALSNHHRSSHRLSSLKRRGSSDAATELGERFYGEHLRRAFPHASEAERMFTQQLSMKLYESRVGSLARLVAFMVVSHEMGRTVQGFWTRVSGGVLGYDMSRTHSIMRIATTASPVSGAAVRSRILHLAHEAQRVKATKILAAWAKEKKQWMAMRSRLVAAGSLAKVLSGKQQSAVGAGKEE